MESASVDPIRPPTSADEEAAKRNTDCVYFLASPLTCKKGSDCEYRHSEGARINPRDCWFWLNGNCLNPKCSFRHPPLDGFLSTPTGTASGPSLPSAQTAITAQVPAAYAPSHTTANKQSTPCYFFQKGGCLKGDRCPYMHDMQPINGSNQQHPGKVAAPPTESPNMSKNPSWTREKAMLQNKLEIGDERAVEVHESVSKSIVKAEVTPTSKLPVNSIMLPTPLADDLANRFQPDFVAHSLPSTTEEPHDYHYEQVDECIRNGREPDDSLRESSPGFDVLVDDEPEDADYFQKDEEFGASEYASENLNLVNDFGYHSTNLDSVSNFEREDEIDDRGHHGRHDYRGHRRSSERMVKRQRVPERKGTWRENSPDKLDASDLRHRLLKQRRLNGPRSMINPDQYNEPCQRSEQIVEDERHRRRNSHRDQRNSSREGAIGNRLQGRITLPGRPSSDNYNNRHSEGLMERGGRWRRSSSPGQPLSSQSRHLDILKQRAYRDADAESRKTSAQQRPDEVDTLSFAGPKSLSELKGAKFFGKTEVPLILSCATANQQKKSEASLSFEGPKPLSLILKRKREEAQGNETDVVSSNGQGDGSNGQDDSQRVIEEHEGGCTFTTIADRKKFQPEDSENVEKQMDSKASTMKSEVVVEEGEEEGLINSDVEVPYEGGVLDTEEGNPADNVDDPEVENNKGGNESEYQNAPGTGFSVEDGESLPPCDHSIIKQEILKTDDGMLVDDKEGPDQNYDQRDEEFEYETANGTNIKTEDGECMYEEDEDEDLDDDDDGDDFARKLGAMLS